MAEPTSPEVTRQVRLALLADLLDTTDEICGAQLALPGFDTWLHTPGQVEAWLRYAVLLVTRDEWDRHVDPDRSEPDA